jgi:hypothetical protein
VPVRHTCLYDPLIPSSQSNLREIVLIPNRHWGGEGLLGCGVGYAIHHIPAFDHTDPRCFRHTATASFIASQYQPTRCKRPTRTYRQTSPQTSTAEKVSPVRHGHQSLHLPSLTRGRGKPRDLRVGMLYRRKLRYSYLSRTSTVAKGQV